MKTNTVQNLGNLVTLRLSIWDVDFGALKKCTQAFSEHACNRKIFLFK